ncbi:hypothetical protein PO857_001093 [Pectobacterium carotovorum]|uniref:hypothetical protein n=1 Tax=Pectobacterium carotovorum TaxID=554 RepID=UPI00254CCDAB|nr:hypothetical protein [Pectobacterium carotovorum]MDK9420308.1 hypothetical protein [Pectobacterium carotovorum]
MDDFFNDKSTKRLIEIYEEKLSSLAQEGEFEKKRNKYMIAILNSMRHGALEWDKFTYYNREIIGHSFKDELKDKPTNEMIDLVFSSLFRFFMEFYFYNRLEVGFDLSSVSAFAAKNKDKFSEVTQEQIDFTLTLMPFLLFRRCYQGDDIQNFIRASEAEKNLKTRMDIWEEKIKEKTNRVEDLSKALEEQEIAYNFVGLYKGFHNLSRAKRVEAKAALFNTRLFGSLTIVPLIFEVIVLTINSSGAWFDAFRISLIPAFALTFILAYYFRVSLSNYQSIKSQIVQIELRKSLCTFIQNYSVYAEKMTDKESLRKFENVVFSNIMPSEDKIPSTFDGIEQIAKLIESVKK